MPVKSSEYEEVNVSLAHNLLPEGVSGSPSRVRKHFWRNMSQTVFSVLCGFLNGRVLPLKIREDGALYIAGSQIGYSEYFTSYATTSDDYAGYSTIEFPKVSSFIQILVEVDDVIVQLKHAFTDLWTDEVIFPVGFWTIPVVAKGIRGKSRYPGVYAQFRVIAYY